MVAVHVTLRNGETRRLDAKPGLSLMEVIRNSGIEDILAICGGSLSCATCHVYVDPAFAERMPAQSHDEDDLLGFSEHRTERSRLSCQLRVTEGFEGLKVTIAPED
jgi:ferredoxin, 2Fe-2S